MILPKKIRRKIKTIFIQHFTVLRFKFLLMTNKIGKDSWIFFLPYGIGDTLFLCSLIEEFKKKNGGKVTILVKKNHQNLVKMFPAVDRCIALKFNLLGFYYEKICSSLEIKKGKIFIPHPLLNSNLSVLAKMLGYKGFSLLDMYKIALQLDENAVVKVPNISDSAIKEAKDFLNKLGFDAKKTVILMPDAFSVIELSQEFWFELINKVSELGFNIIINSNSKNFNASKNIAIFDGDIEKIAAIAILSLATISLRSGICDLLAFVQSFVIAIYPNENSYKNYTLKNLFASHNFNEIIFTQFSQKSVLLNQIISYLPSDK